MRGWLSVLSEEDRPNLRLEHGGGGRLGFQVSCALKSTGLPSPHLHNGVPSRNYAVGLHKRKGMIPAPGSYWAQHLLPSYARESGRSGSQFGPGLSPADRSRLGPLWCSLALGGSLGWWQGLGSTHLAHGQGRLARGCLPHPITTPFQQPPQTLNDRNDSPSFDSTL